MGMGMVWNSGKQEIPYYTICSYGSTVVVGIVRYRNSIEKCSFKLLALDARKLNAQPSVDKRSNSFAALTRSESGKW